MNLKIAYQLPDRGELPLAVTDDEVIPGFNVTINVNTMNSAKRKIREICEENSKSKCCRTSFSLLLPLI